MHSNLKIKKLILKLWFFTTLNEIVFFKFKMKLFKFLKERKILKVGDFTPSQISGWIYSILF